MQAPQREVALASSMEELLIRHRDVSLQALLVDMQVGTFQVLKKMIVLIWLICLFNFPLWNHGGGEARPSSHSQGGYQRNIHHHKNPHKWKTKQK